MAKGNGKWIKELRSLATKRHREKAGLFVAEGPKVVADLLAAGWTLETVYATESGRSHLPQRFAGQADTVSEETLARISFLQHPQGVVALFHLPEAKTPQPSAKELYIALDGVQDPGNVGTIIRIADWFGINRIYCSPDTADAYAPKVVQASMGSIARVEIVYTDLHLLLQSLPADMPVFGTFLDGDNIYDGQLPESGIVVMGNEGNGISPGLRALISKKLLIPNFRPDGQRAESLNVAVATAIVCSEFRRKSE